MGFQIDARMALFPLAVRELVHRQGVTFTPPEPWLGRFEAAPTLATVHWSTAAELGVPVAPAIVSVTTQPVRWQMLEQSAVHPADCALAAANALTLDLTPSVKRLDEGLFYVRLQASPANVDLVAIDLQGNEIPGTRQRTRGAGTPMIFFGPGIMGLRALAPVSLTAIRVANVPPNLDVPFEDIAEVAPACENVTVYNGQAYLGVPLSAVDALRVRLDADAVARRNTAAPAHAGIDNYVHSADPLQGAVAIVRTSLVTTIDRRFGDVAGDPDFAIQEPLDAPGGGTLNAKLAVAALLQFLGASGPVEACTLGTGCTFPVAGAPAESLAAIADSFEQNEAFPLPIVRITGFFAGAKGFVDTGDVAANRERATRRIAFARPLWAQSDPPPMAQMRTLAQPEAQDGRAHADVELAFPQPAHLDVLYAVRRIGTAKEELLRDRQNGPKAFLAVDVDPPQPPVRLSRILDSQVPLPLAVESEIARYAVHRRDEFGRWDAPELCDCELTPWPVTRPTLVSAEIVPGSSNATFLDVRVSWNWTLRRPAEIRFGVRFADAADDPTLVALRPEDGITAPAMAGTQPLRLLFTSSDPDEPPQAEPAANATVTILPPPGTEPAGAADPFDHADFVERTYRLLVRLGDADAIFATAPRPSVAVVADALEAVSGARRSLPSTKLFVSALDPRPPRLEQKPWPLVWGSRPHAGNVSRALLEPPAAAGAFVAGYSVWRAHESAVFDAVLEARPELSAAVDLIRAEQSMGARLGLLQGLLTHLVVATTDFALALIRRFTSDGENLAAGRPVEVSLPGTQTGLELFLFSVRSQTGVVSDKLELADVRAVAVPLKRAAARPALSIVRADDGDLFALTGTCLFVVSSQNPFVDANVRVFWDDRQDLVGSDELLIPFNGLFPLAVGAAKTYVESIEDVLARQPFVVRRLFLAVPPRSWESQSFAVQLQPHPSGAPPDDVPSPRSAIVPLLIAPSTRPRLTLTHFMLAGSGAQWKVAFENLPLTSSFGGSDLLLEFLPAAPGSPASAAASVLKLEAQPLEIATAAGKLTALRTAAATLEITTDFLLNGAQIRVAARDPLQRTFELTLVHPTPHGV